MLLWSLTSEVSRTTMQGTLIFMIAMLLKAQGQSLSYWRCADSNTTGLHILQSNENILGRYNLQICTMKPIIKCDVSIRYYKNILDAAACERVTIGNSFLHSELKCQDNRTCESDKSIVCYSYPIDLLINGCYKIDIRAHSESGYKRLTRKTYIHNNLTQQTLENSFDLIYVTQGTDILWQSSDIPITTFTAELCNITDSNENCTFISEYCKRQENNVYMVECIIPLSGGNYEVSFTHDDVPWMEGNLLSKDKYKVYHHFNVSEVKTDEAIKEGTTRLWIYIVLLVTVIVITLICGCIFLRICKRKPKSYSKSGLEESLVDKSQLESKCIILLVYASKDSKEGQALAKLFADNGANVLDIQSVTACKAAGKSPSEWATKMIQSDTVKIVWLQTKRSTQDEFSMPAIQTFGDTLVQHFLWRMTDTVHQPKPYNKYFLAAFPGAVEFPNHAYIVRFTRFIITESVINLLLYTGTICDINNADGIEQFYKSIE